MKKIPEDLYKQYLKLSKNGWTRGYKKYKELADKYLKSKKEDKLEQGKLVVALARMKIDKKD